MKFAFYDFSVAPFSFDFVAFLVGARSHGCEHLVFVPGERSYQKCSPEQQAFRMKHLLEPLAQPMSYTVCKTREEAKQFDTNNCYPYNYTVDKPKAGHLPGYVSFHANVIWPCAPKPEVMERVSRTLGCKKPITITIRETEIKKGRNSNIEEWMKAAAWLTENGFWPLFIPDTDGRKKFGHFDVYSSPAVDVDERIALYNLSLLNLGVNNGPMAFIFWSQLPGLIYRYHDERFPETSAIFLEKNLIPVGSQPRWFNDGQRIVWATDSAENIVNGVKTWLKVRAKEGQWEPHLVPPLPIKASVSDAKRSEQMDVALRMSYDLGWLWLPAPDKSKIKENQKRKMTVVCYGPSLLENIEAIRNAPRPIMTVSGAHDVLIANGIIPDYHMDCDAKESKSDFTRNPHKDVTYLIASCVHPTVLENLRDSKVMLWHLDNGEETMEWVKKNDPKSFLVCGGSNAGMRALELGMILGYGQFDVFGMDCSFRSEGEDIKRWAGDHRANKQKAITVYCGEDREPFLTSAVMIHGAREIIAFHHERKIPVTLHGHGLAQKMMAEFKAGRISNIHSSDQALGEKVA